MVCMNVCTLPTIPRACTTANQPIICTSFIAQRCVHIIYIYIYAIYIYIYLYIYICCRGQIPSYNERNFGETVRLCVLDHTILELFTFVPVFNKLLGDVVQPSTAGGERER
jgi:hypothetical protein